MIARIRNFQVGLCRGKRESPIRTLDLAVECRDDPGVQRVFLRFFEKKQESLGFVNTVKDNLVVFLPVEDFALTRDLLQGPVDVFFAWTSDVEGNLVWAEVTTAEEPLRAPALASSKGLHVVPPPHEEAEVAR